jgi:chromosomal replication initiation ATPase DnaA
MNIKVKIEDELREEYHYTLGSLAKAICDLFAVRKEDLLGKNRMAYIVQPRHVLYYMGYTRTHHTLNTLASFLDRDHTTVLYGVQKIRSQYLKNKSLQMKIEEVDLLATAYEEKRQKNLEELREEVQVMIERIQMEKLNGLSAT